MRDEALTGLRIYVRFGGWLILPVVVYAAVAQGSLIALVAAMVVVLVFSYAIGVDYTQRLPDSVKPARLSDILPWRT